jgi:DNA-binding transcriptional ArsR family regulator
MELGDAPRESDQEDAQEPDQADQEDTSLRKQDRRRLPLELTGLLTRSYEQGLDHVTRRRILRALHGRAGKEASPSELLANELSSDALSGIAYHAKVLRSFGMIHIACTQQVRGTVRHLYVSNVEDDLVVLSVLAHTEELDAPDRDGPVEGR